MNHTSFITLDLLLIKSMENWYDQGTAIIIWVIINFSNGQVSEQLEHQSIIIFFLTDKNMANGSIDSYSQ